MTKKILVLLMALCLCLGMLAACGGAPEVQEDVPDEEAPAEEEAEEAPTDAVTVCGAIANAGTLEAVQEPVAVSDADEDGALTVQDALLSAHDALYEGGAEAGYATEEGEYGLFITKLWGAENGGSYGYCLNNVSCMSLTDPVAEGDSLMAYAFADAENFSDAYSFFDVATADAAAGDEVTIILSANGYDADWNLVVDPVEGAVITLNGEKTEMVTAEDGTVALTFDEAGEYIVSAVSEDTILVPAVCVVTVA